jgi:hypothetical protein
MTLISYVWHRKQKFQAPAFFDASGIALPGTAFPVAIGAKYVEPIRGDALV